jgi:hypothetical protein
MSTQHQTETVPNPNPGGLVVGTFGGFTVVLLRRGDKYGLRNCLTHDKPEPMVEFYDVRQASNPGFSPIGQFVSRYNASTLLAGDRNRGLCLDGGVPSWSINACAFRAAMDAVIGKLWER